MKHLLNRATLSFGVPLAISAILLLTLNVFLVKKNADGDYIDNGLKYVISSGSDEMSFTEKFEQYQDQGYIDSETITYEGEEVINYRNDIKAILQNTRKEYYPETGELLTDIKILQQLLRDTDTLRDTLENVDKAIERHNLIRDQIRIYGSAILFLFPLYVLPISIGFFRFHTYRWPITIVTFFAGWTGVGYILMLTWSVWPKGRFS